MKIAICVNGLPNASRSFDNIDSIQKSIGGDLFLSTWKGNEQQVEKKTSKHCYYFDEPKVDYHPLMDIPENMVRPVYKTWQSRERCKHNKRLRDRLANCSKQILGHAMLIDALTDYNYDLIVRIRWDTVLSPWCNFSEFLEESLRDNKAIGFGTRTGRHPNYNVMSRIPKIWPSRWQPSPDISNDWAANLQDIMIMYPRKLLDTSMVYELNKNKSLNLGETGWYQVLSKPYGDNHESIYGGAQAERFIR
tara:strand:+ start:2550 stop:3296 length:747 start_codon:yes stop_codon:yes gene_type:complete